MSVLTHSKSRTHSLRAGWQLSVRTSTASTAVVTRKSPSPGAADVRNVPVVASQTKLFGPYTTDQHFNIACVTGAVEILEAPYTATDMTDITTLLGTLAAQPASGSVAVEISRVGFQYRLDFILTAAQIPVTDAAGSGSYGTLKLFDLVQQAVSYLGCRQDYTAFAEGAALTGAAGDAVFKIGVGTVAKAAAADGALAGATDDDIGGEISVTLSAGTGTGTTVTAAGAVADGTTTAGSINLNWSGSAATIDANSTIDVTGTISLLVGTLGDD